jgi:hypothetical protein
MARVSGAGFALRWFAGKKGYPQLLCAGLAVLLRIAGAVG